MLQNLSILLTVNTIPSVIKPKLKLCCVVLAIFSLPLSSPHATLPSSLKAVTAFRRGCDGLLEVPSPVCDAYVRAAIRGRRGAGKLRRKLGVSREEEVQMFLI